jgi:hypothetical protein
MLFNSIDKIMSGKKDEKFYEEEENKKKRPPNHSVSRSNPNEVHKKRDESAFYEEEQEETKCPPQHVPWPNPNEERASHKPAKDDTHKHRKHAHKHHKHKHTKQPSMESSDHHHRAHRILAQKDEEDIAMEEGALSEEREQIKEGANDGHVHEFNPKEWRVSDEARHVAHGTSGGRHAVSSLRGPDDSPGAEPLNSGAHHPNVNTERRSRPIDCIFPGAVREGGLGNEQGEEEDERTIEIGDGEQATVATGEESTIDIIARVVDTEEENRMHHEQDRMRHERDQAVRQLDQLRQMVDNAIVVSPVVSTDRDVESGNENVHAATHDDLPRSGGPKWGNSGRRWFAIGVILFIVVTVAVALSLVLPSESTMITQVPTTTMTTQAPTTTTNTQAPPMTPIPQDLSELISSASSDGGQALATSSTPQNMALEWLAGNPNLANYTDQQKVQRYALATIYYSTKGDSWASNDFWISNADACDKWYQFNDTTIDCKSNGSVSYLDLSNNNLQGTIPREIGMLSDSLGKFIVEEIAVQLYGIPSRGKSHAFVFHSGIISC